MNRLLECDVAYILYELLESADQAALAIAFVEHGLSPRRLLQSAGPQQFIPIIPREHRVIHPPWGFLNVPDEHMIFYASEIVIDQPRNHVSFHVIKPLPIVCIEHSPNRLTIVSSHNKMLRFAQPTTCNLLSCSVDDGGLSPWESIRIETRREWRTPPITTHLDFESYDSIHVTTMIWPSMEYMIPWLSEIWRPEFVPSTVWAVDLAPLSGTHKRWKISALREALYESCYHILFDDINIQPNVYLQKLDLENIRAACDLADVIDICPHLCLIRVADSPEICLTRCSHTNVCIDSDRWSVMQPTIPLHLLEFRTYGSESTFTTTIPIHIDRLVLPHYTGQGVLSSMITAYVVWLPVAGLLPRVLAPSTIQRIRKLIVDSDMTLEDVRSQFPHIWIYIRAGGCRDRCRDIQPRVLVVNDHWISNPIPHGVRPARAEPTNTSRICLESEYSSLEWS